MIPSVVASEVTGALRDFLSTGFGPSNPALASVMDDFLAVPENLVKGPYLSVALPFQAAPEGGEPFPEVPLGHTPYRHQRTAFSRLAAAASRSTVIATGTGSGKTECFLYPILDHCRAESGAKGIKAVVIYPMNALATDQAWRIAETIHRTPALRGRVTAGLFVGRDNQPQRSPHTAMGRDHVITDRDTLRYRPPDILLTNYKMLDYLLIRPFDFRLWRHNEPDTLRYLVVDELHTFDGAQGTDLACLIRRLRVRLRISREKLICAGTSATLGDAGDEAELLDYASRIFDQPFEPGSVVGEVRQSIDAFLGDAVISRHLHPRPRGDLAARVDPARYAMPEQYLRAQHELFFDAPIEGGFESGAWRLALADRLREHAAFVNLLRVLDGRPKPMSEIVDRLRRTLPVRDDREALGVLNGLCALISVARRREGGDGGGGAGGSTPDGDAEALPAPFLRVALHLWIRELRRMVCSLHEEPHEGSVEESADMHEEGMEGSERSTGNASEDRMESVEISGGGACGDEAQGAAATSAGGSGTSESNGRAALRRLRYSDDLQPDEASVHLPLIQCRECRVTGWGAVKRAAEARVELDLRVFYNRFFARDIDVQYLFPAEAPPGVRGVHSTVCGACGMLHGRGGSTCPGCRSERLVRVFRPDAVVGRREGKSRAKRLSRDCPYCGAREALIILGGRAASLLSVALGEACGSRYNEDRKVIAFSDNVQDAAHRGGFFSARNWRNSVRAGVAQVIVAHEGLALADLPERVEAWWTDTNVNPGAFDPERFVSEFIAPDRQWLRDFVALQREGRLPAGSNLPALVARRLRWEALAELGYASAIGRTLERTRAGAVGVDRAALDRACNDAHVRIREEFGALRGLEPASVRALILGVLRRMKDRGAIWSELVRTWLASGATRWRLGRNLALQDFGPRTALPVFPVDKPAGRDGLEPLLAGCGRPKSWYQTWTEKVLTPIDILTATHDAPGVLQEVFRALESAGLICRLDAGRTTGGSRNGVAGGAAGGSAGETTAWALDPVRFYVTARPTVMHCAGSRRTLVVPEQEADLWLGVPCLDLGVQAAYERHEPEPPTWFGRLYRETAIRRIVAAEHTALLTREERERLQQRFSDPNPRPWEPNLLSATPTLELGIDIGDLSTVVLCSVPPAQTNYLQRIGRAGRRDGNAFTATVATGQPHDLYFYAEPLEMLAGRVFPPGVFLNAPAVLERQLTAFCLDGWAATGLAEDAVPPTIRPVLDNVEKAKLTAFPYPFLDFAHQRGDALLEAFFEALAGELTEPSKGYLTAFLHGNDTTSPSLRSRMVNRFLEIAKERKALRADIESLGRRLGALKRGPKDEATTNRIGELNRERDGLQGLLRKLNGRETFNFLTDEGLIPNYAFPEAGVTLKSVIYRQREPERDGEGEGEGGRSGESRREGASERGHGGESGRGDDRGRRSEEERGFERNVYEYVRPAASALSEFAPENEFYAGGRHVGIDRIDLRVSQIETWRLCPSCDYCENIGPKDDHVACPRCGDPLWSDAGQRREMLPLRLVHAAKNDRRARILDERDDREPRFYQRQLVADFEPGEVERAYAMTGSGAPFGFEYVASATFREMNFGRFGDGGQPTVFAGVALPREGFRVCRRCGTVQAAGNDDGPKHTWTCSARKAETADIADCLYLYREFSSEAVQMLLPAVDSLPFDAPGRNALPSDRRISSFVAALELGLRLRFRGRIDHLRATVRPGAAALAASAGARPHRYLLLYDTVPSGTGYLKELTAEPGEMLSVFRMARDALKSCECNQDPAKDGCYRCVFAYRRSREMAETSRDTAVGILDRILDHANDLEEVPNLGGVKVNALLESELEARFIEALRRLELDGEAAAEVRADLVRGKPGYVLKVGEQTYYVEPQGALGTSDGVAEPSRPDFLIRAARPSPGGPPPVAVFTDGFEFHRDATDADSLKRMALVRAGFLVWTLTWHDLEAAFGGASTSDVPDFFAGARGANDMAEAQRALDKRWGTEALRSRLGESALTLLVRYLAEPEPERWKRAVFTELFCLFERERMLSDARRARLEAAVSEELPGQVREALDDLPTPLALAGRGAWIGTEPAFADLFVALPLSAVKRGEPDEVAAVVHLHDDPESRESADYRRTWNGVLRLFNLLQFLPGTWWTTRRGVERNLYPEFAPAPAAESEAPTASEAGSDPREAEEQDTMVWRTPERRILTISQIGTRRRTRGGNYYLACLTDAGVAAFWGSDGNLDNIRLIEERRAPFTLECGCILSNWAVHALWVPENSPVETLDTPVSGPPDEDWEEAVGLAAPELRALLVELSGRGSPVPEVGFELSGDEGAVLAEAELAWPKHKVVVLLPDQEAHAAMFEHAGWRVFESGSQNAADLAEAVSKAPAGEG